jgi:hypothetical protein
MRVNLRLSSIRKGSHPGLSDVAPTFDETLRTIGRSRKPEGHLRSSSYGAPAKRRPRHSEATAGRRRKGPFESSPLRSGGSRFSKATRPGRDDRLAAGVREAVCKPRTEGSIVPAGRSYLQRLFSPLRGGSRFFKSDPSRTGRSIGCLRSRGRMRAKD